MVQGGHHFVPFMGAKMSSHSFGIDLYHIRNAAYTGDVKVNYLVVCDA